MVDGIQVMELSAWSQLPEPLLYRYFSGDLDEAKRKFRQLCGYDCKVAFKINRQYLLVMDKNFRIEVMG